MPCSKYRLGGKLLKTTQVCMRGQTTIVRVNGVLRSCYELKMKLKQRYVITITLVVHYIIFMDGEIKGRTMDGGLR